MNLSNLKPYWAHFKATNGIDDITDDEISSVIEPQKFESESGLTRRIVQNVFAYSLLVFALHGCAV
jgi:hypothetical protein